MVKNIIYAPSGSPLHDDTLYKPMGGADKILTKWYKLSNCDNNFYCNINQANTVMYPHVFKTESIRDRKLVCDNLIMYRVADAVPFNIKYNRLIFYSQDDTDAPCLNNVDSSYFEIFDVVIVLSEYHKLRFQDKFNIPDYKIKIIGNFAGDMFQNDKNIIRKNKLMFCSTPFRGLVVLARIWNKHLQKLLPDYTLEIYSSMETYGACNNIFKDIFDKLGTIKNLNIHSVCGEVDLSNRMNEAKLLVYPNTFPETYCNVVDEAFSCGMDIVTSDKGCLPERLNKIGKGSIVAGNPYTDKFQLDFSIEVIKKLKDYKPVNVDVRRENDWFNDMNKLGLIE